MRRFGLALAFAALLSLCSAQANGPILPGPGLPVASGGGNDPATTAWVNAVVTAGGTVSGTQTTRVNTLIVAMKAHGSFSSCDRLWLWGGESSSQQSKIDIINLAVLTVNSGATLSSSGYTGNNATSLDSNLQPSTFSGNYTLNSAAFGMYETDNGAAGNNNIHGTNATAPGANIFTFAFGTLWAYLINNGGFNSGTNTANGSSNTGGSGTTQGMWGASRTSSTATALYRNGSSTPVVSSSSDTSTSLPASDIQWLAGQGANNNATLASGFVCGGMTGAQWATFAADLNAYMTAWTINVF